MMTEIVTFRLKPGTDEAIFVQNVSELINDFIRKQPGFMKVEIGKDPTTNAWIAIHYFDTLEHNNMAIQNTRASEIWRQDTINIDPASIVRTQYNILIG